MSTQTIRGSVDSRAALAKRLRVGLIVVLLVFVSGCSGGSAPDPQATLEAPFAPLSLIGLGDSLPGAEGCGCTGYIDLYRKAAASSLRTVVNVTNLATNDGVDSAQLLDRIRSDQSYRDELVSADLIGVQRLACLQLAQ